MNKEEITYLLGLLKNKETHETHRVKMAIAILKMKMATVNSPKTNAPVYRTPDLSSCSCMGDASCRYCNPRRASK